MLFYNEQTDAQEAEIMETKKLPATSLFPAYPIAL